MSVARLVKAVPMGTVTFISLLVVSIIPVAAGVTILKEVICFPGDTTLATGSGVGSSFVHPLVISKRKKRNAVNLKIACFIVFNF
jgi:hypothetical protein